MKINEVHKRFKELGWDHTIIDGFTQRVKEDIDSIWLPELIAEIFLEGYEEGRGETKGDYDDGYNQGVGDTECRIASELRLYGSE